MIGPILSPLRSKILSETQFEIERKKAIRRRKEYERKEKERRAGETTVKEELLKQRDQRIRDFVKRMEGGNFQEKTFKSFWTRDPLGLLPDNPVVWIRPPEHDPK